jgi:ATP-dependent Clp protease ATP-binding subunit ClpA
LRSQKIKLSLTQPVKNYLLKEGYSEEYGARALRRTVERELLDKIAEFLLEHRARPLQIDVSIQEGRVSVEGKQIQKKRKK